MMHSEIKIFKGSPVIGKRVETLEYVFNIAINYYCLSSPTLLNRICFDSNSTILEGIYIGIRGNIEDVLAFTDYVISK